MKFVFFRWLALPVAALAFSMSTVASDIEVRDETHFYEVHADDVYTLIDALDHSHPGSQQGKGAHSRTHYALSVRYTAVAAGEGCQWENMGVEVDLSTWLPEWKNPPDKPESLIEQWSPFLQGLEDHEAGHRDLAREAAAELSLALDSLDVSRFSALPCRSLHREVSRLQTRTLMRLALNQRRYDRRTRFGATQGSVLTAKEIICCPRTARVSRSACRSIDSKACLCP